MFAPYLKSIVYAAEGLWHAARTERNLKVFSLGVLVSLGLAAFFQLEPTDWVLILLAGGTFLSVELLNTAVERIASAFYRHMEDAKDTVKHHPATKATKDVAAAAALVTAVMWAAVVMIVLWPYVFEWVVRIARTLR